MGAVIRISNATMTFSLIRWQRAAGRPHVFIVANGN